MIRNENILLIDVGNTSTCVSVGNGKTLARVVRIDTAKCAPESVREVICSVSKGKKLSGSALCSVVPKVSPIWIKELKRITVGAPVIVGYRLNLGLNLEYPSPATIGADRLANVCGVVARHGFPVIVADFGTAATFDVVNANGAFIGGVIAPGLGLMTDYMADRTALLPRIRIDGAVQAIGKNTEQAMKIGAVTGYRGLVREITKHLIKQNRLGRIKLVATGGLAGTVLKGFDIPYRIDPQLTLWGIYRIFELNRK